ncbi:MAG: hypothetical protein WCL51_03970 [Bacteroidota bacterium]
MFKIIIIIISALLICTMLFRMFFRFRFKDFYTSLVYGKYSLQYVDLFKKNDLRSPFIPCIKDEFIFHILMFLKKTPKAKTFTTTDNIQFGNIPFTTTYKEVFRSMGIPFCFNSMMVKNHEIKIIGYQEMLNQTKLKSVYFFINDVFVVGEYLFSDVAKIESLNISKILVKKYISESIDKIEEFYIEDSSKNMIYYRDNGFDLSVKYCNYGDSQVRKILFELGKHMLQKNENFDNLEDKIAEMF